MLVHITPAQLEYLKFLEKHHITEEPDFVSQNQAFKRFGRANVERWIKELKVQRYKRPGRIELKLAQLTRAAETIQDYNV